MPAEKLFFPPPESATVCRIMNRPSRRTLILAAACIVLAGLALLIPGYMADRLKGAMESAGFHVVSIGKIHTGLSGVAFENVALDQHGNSTIALIRAPLGIGAPASIFVSGLVLTGELGPAGVPVIDGWEFRPMAFPKQLRSVTLDSARLDLMTDAGGITIDAKGQMLTTGRKTRRIDAVISGNQRQLTFETRWDMQWNADNSWTAAGEIADFRLRLGNFEMTRAGGALNLQSGKDVAAPPVFKGRLNAGLVTFGAAVLRNAGITVDGPYRNLDVTISGQPYGNKSMQLNAEAKQKDRLTQVTAQLTAPDADLLFGFLLNVNKGFEAVGDVTGTPLTGLLLTQGNIDRVRRELSATRYTSLTLNLTGQSDALNGAVTANGPQPKTVSFDPQSPAH